jgi:DNA polymerase-1
MKERKTVLIFDCNFLAYRSYHVFGQLQYAGEPTGVTFGVLRDIRNLSEQFQATNIVLCFDYGKVSKRSEIYGGYKKKRNEEKKKPENKEKYKGIRKEVDNLRTKIFPELGFKNIWFSDGLEADDFCSIACWNNCNNIIVSADKDLYQLLSPSVSIWPCNEKKPMMTDTLFRKEFELEPAEWVHVKAIAGCSTDEIPGVEGVGETKAVSFLRGAMNKETETYKRIKAFRKTPEYQRNLKLVHLPFSEFTNAKNFVLQDQPPIEPKQWIRLAKRLGMKSFMKNTNFQGA